MKQKFVLQWHLTHKCNLSCKHCYLDEYSNDMSLDAMKTIISQFDKFIQNNNFRGHINFTGGEPLLVMNKLRVLMDFCEECGITFGILTNGTLLTEDIVKELSQYKKLSFVQMSLEGKKKTNDNIRGEGTYNKVFKAIRLLNKYNIEKMISFTVHKNNMNDLGRLIWSCRLHGVKRFWTDRLIPSDNSNCGGLELVNVGDYRRFVERLHKYSKGRFGGTKVECKRALQGLLYSDCDGYMCSAGNTLIALTANGDAMLCRRLPIVVGNIQERTLEYLIDKARQIRIQLESTEDECRDCSYKNKCNNGSRCLTYVVKGNFNGKDINCWI